MEKIILEYAKMCLETGDLAEMFLVISGERTEGLNAILQARGPYFMVYNACMAAQYESRGAMCKRAAETAQNIWEKKI